MIWLYRLLFIPFLLVSLPYYLTRMFKRGGYSRDFLHRFGLHKKLPSPAKQKIRVWIQAVSVGEVNAVFPLVQKLYSNGAYEIILTTTTSTGYAVALEKLSPYCLALGVFPLDFYPCSALAWHRLKPDVIVLMEGELWPEHCQRAKQNKTPLFLINARMSDRSFRRYSKLHLLAGWIVNKPDSILASTQQDAERFIQLGASREKVTVTGNMKFDVASEQLAGERIREELFDELGFVELLPNSEAACNQRPRILLGSSTWAGEEAMLLDAFQTARKAGIDCRLLLVPRHAERRNEICALLELQNDKWHLRSRGKTPAESVIIYVADTTGELNRLTHIADVVFIGKSLPPHEGGQTPIEAAALGKAIVYGPQMSNFREICLSLEREQAAIKTTDYESTLDALMTLLSNSPQAAAIGSHAAQWHAKHRGATAKNFAAIQSKHSKVPLNLSR